MSAESERERVHSELNFGRNRRTSALPCGREAGQSLYNVNNADSKTKKKKNERQNRDEKQENKWKKNVTNVLCERRRIKKK